MLKTTYSRYLAPLNGFLSLALLAGGCNKKQQAAAPPAGFAVPVTAIAAMAQDVPVYLDEIGKATASQSVTIVPQVSGPIMKRDFEDGQDLKKGQLLFEIDPRPFQAQLDQANGQLAKDTATQTSAAWNVQQDQAAMASKAISEQQLHNDIGTRDAAAGAILVDKAEIYQAQLNVDYCSVKSPIDGRAGLRLVDVGNVVSAPTVGAATSLLSIQTLDPIYADFTITESELLKVQQYMAEDKNAKLKVLVQLPSDALAAAGPVPATQPTTLPPGPASDTPHEGVIGTPSPQQVGEKPTNMAAATQPTALPLPRTGDLTFLDNAVQDGSGTVKLRATIPNSDHHFWPGQFLNVRLVLTIQKNAVLVPAQAVQVSQMGPFIYVVDVNGSAQLHPVIQGQRQGDMVVIESGVNAGDSVVVTGQTLLQPGGKVMVVNAPHPGAPGVPVAPGEVPAESKKSALNDSTNNASEGKAS